MFVLALFLKNNHDHRPAGQSPNHLVGPGLCKLHRRSAHHQIANQAHPTCHKLCMTYASTVPWASPSLDLFRFRHPLLGLFAAPTPIPLPENMELLWHKVHPIIVQSYEPHNSVVEHQQIGRLDCSLLQLHHSAFSNSCPNTSSSNAGSLDSV